MNLAVIHNVCELSVFHHFIHVCYFFSYLCPPEGPLPSAMKVRGGSPYSQYEMLGSEGLGIPPQGSADWHRTPGSKMGNKPATSSWPPGGVSPAVVPKRIKNKHILVNGFLFHLFLNSFFFVLFDDRVSTWCTVERNPEQWRPRV